MGRDRLRQSIGFAPPTRTSRAEKLINICTKGSMAMFFRLSQGLLLVLFFLFVFACDTNNDEDKDGGSDASPDATSKPNQNDATNADDGGVTDDDASQSDAVVVDFNCPNGVREAEYNEQCDDGNFFDDDGCTRLCEFSCEDDSDCDDLNVCNGVETCNANHACENNEFPPNGEKCGSDQSCFYGHCKPDVCGDLRVNENLAEECDDGNTDDNDGCTRACQFTCSSDEDCEGGDPCSGASVCDTETHMCEGDPPDDKTTCTMANGETGWCFNESCVPTECGDGEKGGAEECDLGKDNGKPGSACSVNCEDRVCGDNKIRADEMCDDGNRDNTDGCDEDCNAELYYRWNRFEIVREPAPEWCKYAGKNAFGKAFPGAVTVLGSAMDVLASVNMSITQSLSSCSINVISQIVDLNEPSFKFSDDTVNLNNYLGELDDGVQCESPLPIDTPFHLSIYNPGDDDSTPRSTRLVQRPGIIKTESPVTLEIDSITSPEGVTIFRDYQFLLDVDMDNSSALEGILDTVEVPEHIGGSDDDERSEPSIKGRMCAAMDVSDLASTPVDPGDAVCCSAQNEKYHACEEGDIPGEDCDSILDIISHGCFICISSLAISDSCDDCDANFEVIRGESPDIDVDGDGENDAYSIVIAAQATRVTSLGIK